MSKFLDKLDLIILSELDKDCRAPISAIAKKIRKSPQYVKYRVQRLQDEQIIKGVTIFTDLQENQQEVYCFMKFKGTDVVAEKTLMDFLFKMPETHRLFYCDGEYEIIATLIIRDIEQLNKITENILTNFSNIDSLFFNTVGLSEIYLKKYLQNNDVNTIAIKKSTIDIFGKSVVNAMQNTPFATLLELSQILKVTYDKIKYYFKNNKPYLGSRLLLSERFIKKSMLCIDIQKDFEKFIQYARIHPNIVQIDQLAGLYNYAIYFESLPENELNRISRQALYDFKNSIRTHMKLEIIQTYKYRWIDA